MFLVPLGYIAAIAAAAVVVSNSAANSFGANGPTLYLFATSAIGAVALTPSAVAIAVAEVFRLRSVFYFLAVGGGLGAALNQMMLGNHMTLSFLDRGYLVFPAAGFVGGFVYWLIVGRLSGQFGTDGGLPPVRENQPDSKGAEHARKEPVDPPPQSG